MNDDQFDKLFNYLQGELSKVQNDIARVDAKVERVYNLLDQDLKQRVLDEQERLVMGNQLDRHETWIGQLA